MNQAKVNAVGEVVRIAPDICKFHAPSQSLYSILREAAALTISDVFSKEKTAKVDMGPLGEIKFPFVRMGATSTLNLFDLDELILFSFYWQNRVVYKRVADIGANIGLHTVILRKCGYDVSSYEPDPKHVQIINRSLKLNDLRGVKVVSGAVSNKSGQAEFVRVVGNTTGSHLAGAKSSPYGDLDRFSVRLYPLKPIMRWADLIKMDIEGHELEALSSTEKSDWQGTDMMVEVGSQENAAGVFKHMKSIGINLFSQKNGWKKVMRVDDMPSSYKDGSLFISRKKRVRWGRHV